MAVWLGGRAYEMPSFQFIKVVFRFGGSLYCVLNKAKHPGQNIPKVFTSPAGKGGLFNIIANVSAS